MLLRGVRRDFSPPLARFLVGFSPLVLLFCCVLRVLSPSPNVFQLQSVRDVLSFLVLRARAFGHDRTQRGFGRCGVDVRRRDRRLTEGRIRGGGGARSCAPLGEGI